MAAAQVGAGLSKQHEAMLLKESGIDARLVTARGYRTVASKSELERLGFGRAQRNVPALLIPIHDATGEIALYQSRPDGPRIKSGKPIRYETPGGERMALDVHPMARDALGDPASPLFVTEGVKKGDALVSRGLCAISFIGVWNWRGTNSHGGKTALADWEYVALNGRLVYIVFDSDVMLKPTVYQALARLKGFLEKRGAKVALVYLPSGEGAIKQGVDDYLASGGTVYDLLSLATLELRAPPVEEERPECPYRATSQGLVWDVPNREGPKLLTNFGAKIIGDVAEDDGAEMRRYFEIEATLNKRRKVFSVPDAQFANMNWATEHLGAGAVVFPGSGTRDHARAAIQLLSGEVPVRTVHAYTGWLRVGDEGWVYLHASGVIGQVGRVEDIQTELAGGLEARALPDPPQGGELICAIRASLGLLETAPERITVPLLAGTYRSVLGSSDFSLHVSGPTGTGKSELAALSQQHFGPELDARRLTSWEGTENALEMQGFLAKDQVLVLDDFAPSGTSHDVQRLHRKADRVMRAKGNASGRLRMRQDTTLRPQKPPRALILSTGEDVPRGQSLKARMLVLEIGNEDLDLGKLTECQRNAAQGLYAQAMAGFARYLAGRYEEVHSRLPAEHAALREVASHGGQHRRTPGIVADLALGLRHFLLFALEAGAVSEEEAQGLWVRGWQALGEAANAQATHQVADEPTQRFAELLSAAVASGRAHVAGPAGDTPSPKEHEPAAWGWHGEVKMDGDKPYTAWKHQGERIGWLDGEDLFLQPQASFTVAQKQGRDSGDALAVTGRTLRKRLHEHGLLVSTDKNRQVLTVRRTLADWRREVLHLSSGFLSSPPPRPDQPNHDHGKPHTQAGSLPPLRSGGAPPDLPTPDQRPDQVHGGRVEWSGSRVATRAPNQEPDQRGTREQAEDQLNGRVGRVLADKRGEGLDQATPAEARERFTL